ncbi:hypothetical protein ORV05_02075 [Amycolatopsis cynarae]|uniref:Uncharacterized protein n=1 Tax=Amycolatopsis cynarae TaxID=2995223 RepID=A0ABY7B3X5_9PSEU|nr:hypothetical protein [Amycolatopsis sp. HUAS 11-8]WAL66627.1 hypothetical protein ORV05_02075 [Amycolatopsis sp. HUAS 11-8]
MSDQKYLHVELSVACDDLAAFAARLNWLAAAYRESGHEVALSRVRHAARMLASTAGELWSAKQIEETWKADE